MKNLFPKISRIFFLKERFYFYLLLCHIWIREGQATIPNIFVFPFGNVRDTLCTELLVLTFVSKNLGKNKQVFVPILEVKKNGKYGLIVGNLHENTTVDSLTGFIHSVLR